MASPSLSTPKRPPSLTPDLLKQPLSAYCLLVYSAFRLVFPACSDYSNCLLMGSLTDRLPVIKLQCCNSALFPNTDLIMPRPTFTFRNKIKPEIHSRI